MMDPGLIGLLGVAGMLALILLGGMSPGLAMLLAGFCGMAALNPPSSTGTGDWHFVQTFERERQHRSRSFISGAGCLTDTTGLLGDAGIYEASELLRTLGIGVSSFSVQ